MNHLVSRLPLVGLTAIFVSASALPGAAATQPKAPATCNSVSTEASFADPTYAERPFIAEQEHLTGSTVVKVDLDENGHVRGAMVVASSGMPVLDKAAMNTMRAARYVPATSDCKAVPGSYTAQFQFED